MTVDLTALAVPLFGIDKHVSTWRHAHDPSGRAGVPAHVSVLVPFVDPPALDADVVRALGEVVAAIPAFDVSFSRTARFPNALWLAPDPHEPFVALTQAVCERWPDHPPYEGAYPEVIPHLTIAYELEEEAFRAIETDVSTHLPLQDRATEVHLLQGSNATGWLLVERLPLGT